MAVISDKKMQYLKQIAAMQKQTDDGGMDTDAQQAEVSRLNMLIDAEEKKTRQYQIENIRRKHNYLPLIVEILKLLAKDGKLVPLYEKAKERTLKRQKQKTKAS